MALDAYTVTRANARNGGADALALVIERFNGMVEGTLERKSALKGWVNVEPVTGTATLRVDGVGESTIQTITAGATPDGSVTEFGKNTLTIDTVVLARAIFPLLDTFQQNFNKQQKVATEHGKKLAKLWDQAMFIQAIQAAISTNSRFYSSNELNGHSGGSSETLAAAGDAADPSKLYAAIARLLVKMELKDVEPQSDDCILGMRPDVFYTLLQAEQLINSEYITSQGNKVQGMVLKAYGIPAIRSNNHPAGSNITGHALSTAANSNAYDVDASKHVLTVFSPQALLAGETIPLTSDVFYDKVSKQWFVDAHMSYGATPGRAEFAGAIVKP